jgi:DNA-binding transcriptional ArsR family regulator
MDVDTNLSNSQDHRIEVAALPDPEPRKLTDPRAMRAVAHPVRIALLEVLGTEGPLTATEAGELIGESPTTCSFHLRQLAKYGFIEEVAGVAGRKRPWRLVNTGMSYSDVSDDTETRLAANALSRVLHDFYLDRLKEGLELRRDISTEWQKTTGASEFLLYVTPEELRQLDQSMTALARQFVERIGNPKKRPKGSIPIELLFFAYPRPAHRGYPRAAR